VKLVPERTDDDGNAESELGARTNAQNRLVSIVKSDAESDGQSLWSTRQSRGVNLMGNIGLQASGAANSRRWDEATACPRPRTIAALRRNVPVPHFDLTFGRQAGVIRSTNTRLCGNGRQRDEE